MPDGLEAPSSIEELYLARGNDEVVISRPILTGDVVSEIEIPGVSGTGDAIVLTHPCSMRRDGVNLAEKLLVARVRESEPIPFDRWPNSFYGRMPLPELHEGSHSAAYFDEMGLVPSDLVEQGTRQACLSRKGINLLQQRFVWYLTRFAVPTHKLDGVSAAVFEEADLAEEWVTDEVDRGVDPSRAAHEFHDWIRADDAPGITRQARLGDPQALPAIRKAMRDELKRRAA